MKSGDTLQATYGVKAQMLSATAAYVRPAGDRKDGYATETSSKLEHDSAG